jgi:hypothetical protein
MPKGIKISGAYSGQFSNSVPSVGSRMPGTVRPSYGKSRIVVRFAEKYNPVRQDNTGQWIGGRREMQPHDIDAESPRRLSRRQRAKEREMREFLKIKSHLVNPSQDAKPRLIKTTK